MSRYNHSHESTFTEYLVRALFMIVGIALLSIFCPREATQTLQYHLDEPWDGDALIARDSFIIHRSDSAIERERIKIYKEHEPFYEIRADIAEAQIEQFKHELDSVGNTFTLPHDVRNQILMMLSKNYEAGILPDSSYSTLIGNKISTVHLYSNNESRHVDIERLKPQKDVYDELMQQGGIVHEVLVRIKINRYIQPNLILDDAKNQSEIEAKLSNIPIFKGRVQVGEKIVDKGQIISESIAEKLDSYIQHENSRQKTPAERWSQLGGQILFIALMIVALFMFFHQFRSDYLHSLRHMLLIGILCLLFPLITYIYIANEWTNVYIIPYCMLPILIRVFMDSRTAFITHIISIMLSAIAIESPFDFVCIEILAGLTAIYSLKQLQQRSDLFIAVVLVIGTSLLARLCMDLINMNFVNSKGADIETYIGIAAGGGLILISYLLLFPIEKTFKFTSTVTLVELSNINNPILRKLSEEAPGTFQHSMQVANLAAEVANRMGANAQLVRTGALYHDIGKLKNPVFFTENQSGNNPHNSLPFEDSAQIIIQHVKYGLELAQKNGLPQSIKNFISSHHGRSKTRFFYISYVNQNPGKEVNEEIFTYPGPNPASLEEAILMMADSVEAASRSLNEYTEESVSTLVDRIIDTQVKEGMFARCPITFENIDTAKQTFKEKLKSIYHTRISYPELKK